MSKKLTPARNERATVVHYVSFSSQPDIQIYCTGAWSTPDWPSDTAWTDIYKAESGDLYTFEENLVTCTACKAGCMV